MPRYVYSRTLAEAIGRGAHSSNPPCVGWGRVQNGMVIPITGTPFDSGPQSDCGSPRSIAEVPLDAPFRAGGKLVCAARNYAKHAAELSNPVPAEPLIFMKPASSVIADGEAIKLPIAQSSLVHHEGELAVVIGRRARRIRPEDVARHILGYTLINDVTARDLQRRDGCFTRAKGFDTFAPLGPWLDTDFQIRDQRLRVWVNESLRQDGRLDEMLFDVPTLISWVSEIMTLEPGDVIATGTPSGVDKLEPGDTVCVQVDELGTLTNPVRAGG